MFQQLELVHWESRAFSAYQPAVRQGRHDCEAADDLVTEQRIPFCIIVMDESCLALLLAHRKCRQIIPATNDCVSLDVLDMIIVPF